LSAQWSKPHLAVDHYKVKATHRLLFEQGGWPPSLTILSDRKAGKRSNL
jgi:hypothetical protein